MTATRLPAGWINCASLDTLGRICYGIDRVIE